MQLTAFKWVLAIYLNALSYLTQPQKKKALSCPQHHVHMNVCKKASFPRAASRAMERIPWLAAAWEAARKHKPEQLSAARPLSLQGSFCAQIKFSAVRFRNRVHHGDCCCLLLGKMEACKGEGSRCSMCCQLLDIPLQPCS